MGAGAASESSLWFSFLAIAGVWLFTVLSPGPNFLATVQVTLNRSRGSGLCLSAGIALGTTIWATASLLGLGLLFQTAGWLYLAVKFAGAAYLILLGFMAIRDAGRSDTVPARGSSAVSSSPAAAFRQGLLVDLSNPKAAAFFTSLFAVALPPTAPLWFNAMVIATVVAMAGGWYAVVACIMDLAGPRRLYARVKRALGYVMGTVFIALGLRLALQER